MDIPAASCVLSAQTEPTATNRIPFAIPQQQQEETTTEDQQEWRDFLSSPKAGELARKVISKRLGFKKNPDRHSISWTEDRVEELVGMVFEHLVEATGYRRRKGNPMAFATAIMRWKLASDVRARRADRRNEQVTIRLGSAMRMDPESTAWESLSEEKQTAIVDLKQAVRETVERQTGDPRAWADMYLKVERELGLEPINSQRHDPLRQTQQRLGWTRTRCDHARASLAYALADLRPMRCRR